MTEEQKRETDNEYDKILNKAVDSDTFLIALDEVIHVLNDGMTNKEKLERSTMRVSLLGEMLQSGL